VAEVVAFGEAMVRLLPPGHARLERATSLGVEVGGAELNTAAGLVRLGHSAAWVSRLPDNPLGRLVHNRVWESGVEPRVQLAADGRCGLYFLEEGAAPRPSGIVYDRAGSSFAAQPADAFDWPRLLSGARWFHVTGITPALGDTPLSATRTALRVAKALGLTTSIDLNYRAKLWDADAAGRVMGELLHDCDVLLAGTEDAANLFGVTGADFAAVARQLCDRFGLRTVAGVKREAPGVWRNRFGGVGYHRGEFHETPWYEVEIVDRLGAGDAFAAGLIHGLLAGDFGRGLHVGAAFGALKHTVPGDLPTSDLVEVEAVLAGGGLRVQR
jgi:2-dehydro-3-deoxygluconokinase